MFAVAIVMVTAAIVAPAGQRLLHEVRTAAALSDIQGDLGLETSFGALNILLALCAMAIAVWRPRLMRGDGSR
jgi:hypothetical protein